MLTVAKDVVSLADLQEILLGGVRDIPVRVIYQCKLPEAAARQRASQQQGCQGRQVVTRRSRFLDFDIGGTSAAARSISILMPDCEKRRAIETLQNSKRESRCPHRLKPNA